MSNHCEFIFSDRHYGNAGGANCPFPNGFTARLQDVDWQNIPGGLNANLNAIENHNPNLSGNVHGWIPVGLCYDLIDNRNDNLFNSSRPIDNVTGYTTGQCFNALQSDIRTIPAFKDRLLQQNSFNQQANINILFNGYNY